MTDTQPNQTQPEQRASGAGGSAVVVGVLLFVAAGTAAWFMMDHSRDMLNKDKGRVFAASFEKECLPKFDSDYCKEVAGVNHSQCLRGSATQTDGGVDYSEESYLDCMRTALDSRSAEQ